MVTDAGGTGDGSPDAADGGIVCPAESFDASACVTERLAAESLALDIYLLLDRSQSMGEPIAGGGTKWTKLADALAAFVSQPNAAGISVGLGFFPAAGDNGCTTHDCSTDADCGTGCGLCVPGPTGDPLHPGPVCSGYASPDSCTRSDYASPAVEIQPLSLRPSWMTEALLDQEPSSGSPGKPTSAALAGALDHARAWRAYRPSDTVIVIAVTDGYPTECDARLPDIEVIAATGFSGAPAVPTFVIGLGTALSGLDGVAQAGGSSQAFLMPTTSDPSEQIYDALTAVRDVAGGCSYVLPSPGAQVVDPDEVNVQYAPATCVTSAIVPRASDGDHCPAGGDAWYYDDPAAPTRITLCPATCSKIRADGRGRVEILLGCPTVPAS